MAEVYNAGSEWTKELTRGLVTWPSEYVIRIFKGQYPRLNLPKDKYGEQSICDVGCGDGINLVFLKKCGFREIAGVEITDAIVRQIGDNLASCGIEDARLGTGTNDKIPFGNGEFDYLLSWNACYYMGPLPDFNVYVPEFARVVKPGGYLVMSIPKKTSFIFQGSEEGKPGYRVIRQDPFGVRNGEVLRCFDGEEEIEKVFGTHFEDFSFGSVHDDCFGYNYHWHLVVCRRKG